MKKLLYASLFLFVVLSVTLAALSVFVWYSLDDLPSIDALKDYQPPQSTMVYDRNGDVVGRFFDERRTVISLEFVPKHVKLAFIAAEDGDFFAHGGIDYVGLMRAIVLEIKHRTIGGRREGGSTITQQTARTMLLSSQQTYGRKIKEMILAQRIEKALTKDQILHLYLNQIYFGNGAYGIEEAAQTYFSKPAKKLTLYEAAALASIPKSPNRINPFGDKERLIIRQHYVLDRMLKQKFIDQKTAEKAKLAPLFADVTDSTARLLAPYFLQTVRNEIAEKLGEDEIKKGGMKIYSTLDVSMQRAAETALKEGLRRIDKRYGFRGPIVSKSAEIDVKLKSALENFKKNIFASHENQKIWDLSRLSASLVKAGANACIDKIRLTNITEGKIVGARVIAIDDRHQKATVDLGSQTAFLPMQNMAWALPAKAKVKKISDVLHVGDVILVKLSGSGKNIVASLEQDPGMDGGLVALQVSTGNVLAMVGGYDYERSPFNRIMQAKRQPGSGIKPLIYGLAFDQEVITAASIITDEPRAFLDPGTNEYWRPRNHTRKFLGDITVRHCLRSSINICTITLLERIGIDGFLNFAKVVGLNTESTPFPRNLTIALGSAEAYPIDVANAMRIFPNLGVFGDYHLVNAIEKSNHERETLNVAENKVVMRPEAAFVTTQILRNVISEADRAHYLSNVESQMAGKTGTTNDVRSAWFFGYTPDIIALVYVGYDDNRSIGSTEWGTTTAFPIWANFMNAVVKEENNFQEPENIEWHYVDKQTGKKEELFAENTIMEAFIAGTAPKTDDMVQTDNPIKDEAAFLP